MVAALFDIPDNCRFKIGIPKNQFEKEFRLSPAESRLLRTPFLPVRTTMAGSLRTDLSHIPPEHTTSMDYEDILFIDIEVQEDHFKNKSEALLQLYQKYIPKPVVLVLRCDAEFIVCTALKRYHESDPSRRVVRDLLLSPVLRLQNAEPWKTRFLEHIRYDKVNKHSLWTTYESYCVAVAALMRANYTHQFYPTGDLETIHRGNNRIAEINKAMKALRNKIFRSNDIREQINDKLALKKLKSEYEQLTKTTNETNQL